MLISFILPVYNAERYLSICLDSILNQGIEKDDFEIILVEDCSTDGSLQICKDYSSKYKNIFLIENDKNIGVGLTRNKGMACAKGEYIHFVDSDDYLFPNSIQKLLSLDLIKYSPDIIWFEYNSTTNNYKGQNKIIYKPILALLNDTQTLLKFLKKPISYFLLLLTKLNNIISHSSP